LRGKADIQPNRPKADIGKRHFDHFQPASLTRYDASL
jgi:hypothetical protein